MEIVSYHDEFYPSGFRKFMAMLLVLSVTALPEVFSWVSSPEPPARSMPSGRFSPRGGFLEEREGPARNILSTLWTITKRCFVMLVCTLGLMLYYPRSGFKRYSLLCGPILALTVPLVVSAYLSGRTEVFRAEILVVTLVSLVPGVGLYIFLTWRKAQSMGMVW